MMADFASLELTVIDTVSLTHTFHERGVNMRYVDVTMGILAFDPPPFFEPWSRF